MRRAVLTATCLLFAATACGTRSDEEPDPRAGTEWQVEQLSGEPGVDFPGVHVTDGDDALVLLYSHEGVLQPHLSTDGGAFRAGTALDTGVANAGLGGAVRLEDGSWLAVGSGGMTTVDGDEESVFAAFALASEDGLVWRRVDVTGIDGAVDIEDVAYVDGHVVVVGNHRSAADPSMGGFVAAAWTSEDGRGFTEVELPGAARAESSAAHAATSGDTVLAAGRVGRSAALWSSPDAGETWSRVEDPAITESYALTGLEARGATVLATLAETSAALVRSTDGGATWQRVDGPVSGDDEESWAPLWATAGGFLTVAAPTTDWGDYVDACYAEPEDCGWDAPHQLWFSEDGSSWSVIDTDGLGEIDEVVGTEDGRTLVFYGTRSGTAAATWPAGEDLPAGEVAVQPTGDGIRRLPEGEEPEVGVTYAAPLYLHCGMDQFWFGGDAWQRTDDGPGVETGAGDGPPDGWPVQGESLYGFATLLEDGSVEYSLEDGTVIATYEPAAEPVGCM